MRIVMLLVLLLFTATLAWTADIKPIPVPLDKSRSQLKIPSTIKQIAEIKQIKFKGQPVVIKLPDSEPAKKPRSVIITPDAEAAYKSGSGIVFTPSYLRDFSTSSVCNIYLLTLSPEFLTKLQDKDPNIKADMTLIDQANSSAHIPLCNGTFNSIPQGMHTYVFTCRIFVGDDANNRIFFYIGDQQIGPDKQTINTSTNEISIIFTYQPKDQYSNFLNITAFLQSNTSQSTYSRGISFWYMQLVMLN